ncbi:hypothetical protein SAMN05443575_3418 [Jatrophihabitans endophyticus]|uniref:Transcriptional regulator, AbiEi antitoxin, Type IV TA system n=1 Tax=Jatrophihabitans endophyticus TaxID=1206085 RepID=A0A1M5R1C0_9ACTN|nr:hypothetical protein [Jatrophihabitans endophyticus]SHH20227.1 hypothetical protein SAMN05443575_3418 [Jatrophihabitans endophyticus]
MPVDLAALPRVLTLADASDLGLSESAIRHAIATRGWQRLTRGVVFTRPDPPLRDDWAQAGLAVAGGDGAVSGWDAARIRGIGAAQPPSARVLILTGAGHHRWAGGMVVRPTRRPYRCTVLPAEHPTLPFVPVVHAARAVTDTALLYRSLTPVRALVTSAIQRRLCRPEDIVHEYETGPRGGSFFLRRALADLLTNAHSVAEAEAADALASAHVPSFELNVDIVDPTGRLVATADVLWRRLRAIGEVQSREFHFSEQDWIQTMDRHNRLTGYGVAVAHWAPTTVRSRGPAWAADVASWLRHRADELGVPYVPGAGAVPVGAAGHPPFVVG